MVNWKYFLLAQYPALAFLAVLFLVRHLLVRKRSAIRSVLWVLLFGAALTATALFAFLGVHYGFWSSRELFSFRDAGWFGLILLFLVMLVRMVHNIEKKRDHSRLEKELRRAEKEKDDAVAQEREAGQEAVRQAHEEGRLQALQEAETRRLAQAESEIAAEARGSDFAQEAGSPIELKWEDDEEW